MWFWFYMATACRGYLLLLTVHESNSLFLERHLDFPLGNDLFATLSSRDLYEIDSVSSSGVDTRCRNTISPWLIDWEIGSWPMQNQSEPKAVIPRSFVETLEKEKKKYIYIFFLLRPQMQAWSCWWLSSHKGKNLPKSEVGMGRAVCEMGEKILVIMSEFPDQVL